MLHQRVVPMIHVPNVRAAAAWYVSIGFSVLNTFEDEVNGMTFASLAFGVSEIFLSGGGRPSTADRRDVDLYLRVDDVDRIYERLKDRVQIRIELKNTSYGTREFVVRDLNGLWVTFGEELGEPAGAS
jgi:uncharacterized glyoxalase superfamily protein PhnB